MGSQYGIGVVLVFVKSMYKCVRMSILYTLVYYKKLKLMITFLTSLNNLSLILLYNENRRL